MKKIIQIIGLSLVLISSNLFAKTISDKSLTQVMELSGLNEQIAQYPNMALMGMEQERLTNNSIPNDKFLKMKTLMLDAYNTDEMLAIIKKEIQKTTSQKDADVLISWYKSPLGKKITDAEKKASTPNAYSNMLKEAPTLLQDKKRVYFARLIDRSINATKMTIQIQKKTSIAVFIAISRIIHPEEKVDVEKYKIIIAAQDEQIEVAIEQMMILSFVYSYKNISIDNLEKYIVFLQKDDVSKFNNSVVNGIVKALDNASKKMTRKLN